ncbi:hypothetical protein NPIL_219841 [Nephila pilipes]|uniref:Uncharacterized protein n=1 Tax=Nephila pilipes TaxID=299642 RepID=A0A8X6QRV6_NEPPI|nr:hypothetical protein NPIL_445011 [Nephila pilipes]GFU34647.1 hypothetical protein NPIL_37711 [Nephila pilipes]GFU41176.1 hypothetical protein NPIL_64891 [Nephila pilipes]GFU54102.1 hypothetical protein NPIL_219841 [Nephila pilipes]
MGYRKILEVVRKSGSSLNKDALCIFKYSAKSREGGQNKNEIRSPLAAFQLDYVDSNTQNAEALNEDENKNYNQPLRRTETGLQNHDAD